LKNIIKNLSISSEYKEERVLGEWIRTNKKSYKMKNNIMKKKNIREIWEDFTKKYLNLDKFQINIELYQNFIDNNKKRPKENSIKKDEKYLAQWIFRYVKDYKNNLIKEEKIKNKMEEFLLKNSKYFVIEK
jgi:hypothetical protein